MFDKGFKDLMEDYAKTQKNYDDKEELTRIFQRHSQCALCTAGARTDADLRPLCIAKKNVVKKGGLKPVLSRMHVQNCILYFE